MAAIRRAVVIGSHVIRWRASVVFSVMMAHALPQPQIWVVSRYRSRRAGLRGSSLAPASLMERAVQNAARLDALVASVGRARDEVAFKELFDHFAPRVKGYLMRHGASAGVAEDLAQEAMLILWRKAGLFDSKRASASTWVFTIARNLRIDQIRRERRPEIDSDDPSLRPDAERAADERIDWAQAEGRLHQALVTLPREQAEVIELSFLADKPHSVIASELGLPLGTVKSRIRLAMAHLRRALGDRS